MTGTSDAHVQQREVSGMERFGRSQVASFVATLADFGLLFFLTEVLHAWYVPATAVGAFAGAVTNFLMNRHWSFSAAHDVWHRQAMRYSVASGGSLLLNTGGTWAVTEFLGVHYSISVIVVSLVVGFGFNYPMHRFWVFKSGEAPQSR